MAKFVFVKDGQEFDYGTRSITVKQMVEVELRKALWKSSGRLSVEELTELGVSVKYTPDQTEERIDYERIVALYTANPDFATRVAEWKAIFDELGVSYDATVADITAAEEEKFGEDSTARADFHDRFMGKRTEVMVNYQAAERAVAMESGGDFEPVDDYTMWTSTAALVKWLPGTYDEEEIPVRKEPEIIASSEREAEIREELN